MSASNAESETDYEKDNVAAIIRVGNQYLLQHREALPEIAYPGWWCLFGGARESGETAEQAIIRELEEELKLVISESVVFLSCIYERGSPRQRARKIYFDVAIKQQEADSLILCEGQRMRWLTFSEVLELGHSIVPYDISALALHFRMTHSPESLMPNSSPF